MADHDTNNKRKRDSSPRTSPVLSHFFKRLSGRTSPNMSSKYKDESAFLSESDGEPGPAVETKKSTTPRTTPSAKNPLQSEDDDDTYKPTLLKPLTFEIQKAKKPSRYDTAEETPVSKSRRTRSSEAKQAKTRAEEAAESKRVGEENERIRGELEAEGIHVKDFATGYETKVAGGNGGK